MKAKKLLLTSLVLGVLALRCGGETGSPQSGSESHFLDTCENDKADCGPDLKCVCGLCTRTCETSTDCSGLASNATCATTLPICREPRRCELPAPPPKNDGGVSKPIDGGVSKPIDAGLPRPNDASVPTIDAAETPDAAREAAVPIDGTVVAADAAIPRCTGGPCFCQNFPECTPAQEHTSLPLGSTARRICGIGFGLSGRYCLVTAYSETEGGLAGYRCKVPFRQTCDAWSPATMCQQVLSCNLLMGNCPQDPLDCDEPAVPGDAAVTDARPPISSDASTNCASIETEIVAEWAKVSECQTSADCTVVYNNLCASSGSIIGNVGCFLPLSRSASVTHLAELETKYIRECNGQNGTCDCAPPPPATCAAGHCRAP